MGIDDGRIGLRIIPALACANAPHLQRIVLSDVRSLPQHDNKPSASSLRQLSRMAGGTPLGRERTSGHSGFSGLLSFHALSTRIRYFAQLEKAPSALVESPFWTPTQTSRFPNRSLGTHAGVQHPGSYPPRLWTPHAARDLA